MSYIYKEEKLQKLSKISYLSLQIGILPSLEGNYTGLYL